MVLERNSALFHNRERRKSLFDPSRELSRQHSFADGDTIVAATNFGTPGYLDVPITFKVDVQVVTLATATGVIFEIGDGTTGVALVLDGGDLIAAAGAQGNNGADGTATDAFRADGHQRSIVMSIIPGTGQLQVWADGLLVIEETAVGGAFFSGLAASAEVVAGGTGYSVNDVLTLVGGTGTAATFTVTTVDSGVVTGVSLTTAGSYTVLPADPVSTTVAPAGGSGCTLNVSWAEWAANSDGEVGGVDGTITDRISAPLKVSLANAIVVGPLLVYPRQVPRQFLR
jgi:hypothetical protein